MRQNFKGDKRRKEEIRKKRQEEKRNKRLNKKEQIPPQADPANSEIAGEIPGPVLSPEP